MPHQVVAPSAQTRASPGTLIGVFRLDMIAIAQKTRRKWVICAWRGLKTTTPEPLIPALGISEGGGADTLELLVKAPTRCGRRI
jgi:hypothetical protein